MDEKTTHTHITKRINEHNSSYISGGLIGEFVQMRENKGLSQKKLSQLCGVTQPVIARMERSVHSPQLNTFLKILDPLGYTLKIVPK